MTADEIMALADHYSFGTKDARAALESKVRAVCAERDALAAAMPSEGADAALAYAAERTAREKAEAECERLRRVLVNARDSTHTSAVVLRGLAAALQEKP